MVHDLYTPFCGSVTWQGVLASLQSAHFQSRTDRLVFIPYVMVVVKVKVTLEQATTAQRKE
jgi:hypothetical protein